MVRGVDYQLCPKCRIPVQLWDGCNHMQCGMCGVSFCWICGREQEADSGHWMLGSCSRYGPVGTPNAQFDEPAGPLDQPADLRLDGPTDGETWFSLPVRNIQNYLMHEAWLEAEVWQHFELIVHSANDAPSADDARELSEIKAFLAEALCRQFMQTVEPPPPEIGSDGDYHIWLDADLKIRLTMRRHPGLIRAIRAHAPRLAEALDFYTAHRDEFETHMLAHLATNPPPPREMGLAAPGPNETSLSLQTIEERSVRFMKEAIAQVLRHPDTRALDGNAESFVRMALHLRDQIWRMIVFVPQDRGEARSEGAERAFLEGHLSRARAQ
ncbi:hypothetical protein EJ03DRAFT_51141 [Teratosphaeria nubilosa]|uniref:RING-type domain-containing protein n=1 Tax=Teratosphaeria nubilosa TaxID=161662 RepID=A0A6G1LFL6_9PEZI|nr:hypothetical protein EJ03DRAFT_51141 [Teratosphaeria nubilosa]